MNKSNFTLMRYLRAPETKQLIAALGIEGHCIWFPAMFRKHVMPMLQYIDLGASEFVGMYWCGCGWEFLASGVPMLHSLEDPENYDTPDRPPALPQRPFVRGHPRRLVVPRPCRTAGKANPVQQWYRMSQRKALARCYVELFDEIALEKGPSACGKTASGSR